MTPPLLELRGLAPLSNLSFSVALFNFFPATITVTPTLISMRLSLQDTIMCETAKM